MRVEPRPDEEVRTASPWRTLVLVAVVVWIGWQLGVTALVVILALIFMIFLHELGHYVTAKAAGMKVTEFFIGFGPRIWSFHRGETEYGFKAIPAGAYVRIIGMSNLEEVDPAEEHRTYRDKPYWRRLSVALAGSAMHFLVALVLAFSIYAGFGVEDVRAGGWRVASVVEGSAAEEAGIRPGDRIVSVDGNRFPGFEPTSDYLRAHPDEEVAIEVVRGGETLALDVTLGSFNPNSNERVGFLGVGPDFDRERVGPITAAGRSVDDLGSTMWASVRGLGQFFSPDGIEGYIDTIADSTNAEKAGDAPPADDRLISALGAGRLAVQAAENSAVDGLWFLFLINIFVGVFNLVPLLPLDGGHVAIATYEKIRSLLAGRRYQADVGKLLPLTYAVFLVLVLVGVTSLWVDITNPVDNPFN